LRKAVVVDRDYGSVTIEDLESLKERFKQVNIDLAIQHFTTEEELIAGCLEAEAILATGNPPITEKVLQALPQLALVQRFGIGVNSIDLKAATESKTVALNMPGFCVNELAAHATSLILGLYRNTAYYDRHIRSGNDWPKATYYAPKSIPEMTLGLYGFGGSAKPLYEIFNKGFGSKVLAYDPFIPEADKANYNVSFVDFDTLLSSSDVTSLHAPLNEATRHIFNREAFQKMKQDSMIVNIARGPLIDEEALIEALQMGEIRFAGLDVYETEPLKKDSPLLTMDNVLLTPHSAFYGEGSKATQLNWAFELVSQALNKQTIHTRFVANREICTEETPFTYDS